MTGFMGYTLGPVISRYPVSYTHLDVYKRQQLRGLLAVMVLGVAAKLSYDLIATPADLYALGETLSP